jgi:tetratricopeptide (TPR) repeat protein
LYQSDGRFPEAEGLYQRSLVLLRKLPEPNISLGIEFNNLAMLYVSESRYGEAEGLFQKSLSILNLRLGPEHPALASVLSNLALLASSATLG